jgi:chitinase
VKKSLRRALWAGAVVAVAAATVPMVQASAAVACAPAWNATTVYTKGNLASYQSKNYEAQWWSQNENPATNSGPWQVWVNKGDCGGPPHPPPHHAPDDPADHAAHDAADHPADHAAHR